MGTDANLEALLLSRGSALSCWPSSPGELHPEALTEPCLSLSTHTARVIHQELPPCATISRFLLLQLTKVIATRMTCPLRSTDITPLHHYYRAVRP